MATLADAISEWLRERVSDARADGVAVGLSGGIDSAVVVALAARALGPERVTPVIMPANSQTEDLEDARLVARSVGIDALEIELSSAFQTMIETLPSGTDLAVANIKPRLRMITLYHIANTNNLMVVGTGNKSELLVGYFTKYGDGGVDLLPLGSLYKHQVRDLARALGIPDRIIQRPPSAGLWAGQTDEEEMGLTYEELDGIIDGLERGDTSGFDHETVRRVEQMISRSAHKRALPPVFTLSKPVSMLEMA